MRVRVPLLPLSLVNFLYRKKEMGFLSAESVGKFKTRSFEACG